ncbi:MAG: DUF429 domain-containing protein [Chloroflexi bacterium]|nr:DUF429 domain-containing protein [Chloroflexota bacterium]
MANVLGIDLTAGKRPSGYAALDGRGQLLELGLIGPDDALLALAERLNAAVAAIDSPLGLPLGLCCFDEAHGCAPTGQGKGKASERALSALGIPCYYTTKRSIIKNMVLRAMRLAPALAQRGAAVIEVYPYAVKVRLWCNHTHYRAGCGCIPLKTSPTGLAFLHARLCEMFPNLDGVLTASSSRFTHDVADALLVAWTAHLFAQGRTEALGDLEEGPMIILPTKPPPPESAPPAPGLCP